MDLSMVWDQFDTKPSAEPTPVFYFDALFIGYNQVWESLLNGIALQDVADRLGTNIWDTEINGLHFQITSA